MTLSRHVVRALIAAAVWGFVAAPVRVDRDHATSAQANAITARVAGFEATPAWFRRVREHRVWEWDDAAKAVSALPPEALQRILSDVRGLRRLLDAAASTGATSVPPSGGQ